MGRSGDVPRQNDSGTNDRPDNNAGVAADDSGCSILHVDMDAFFASVEIQRRPELVGKPVVVGGATRGVVAAASYEARRYGIRSAMPMSQAQQLCNSLVVLPPDRAAYQEVSQRVMAILGDISPALEQLSIDEAFLDVRSVQRVHGRPAEIAALVRRRVRDEVGLTCSVGVAPNKFLAKLASASCKPDGLLVVPVARVLEFLHPLPVTVLWGVGARTAEPLHRLGIRSVADLAATPLPTLERAVGVATATHLMRLARGEDERSVSPVDAEKSISSDHTTAVDLTETVDVERELLRVAEDVARRVRERGLVARTVGIKIRFADFTTVTRVRTLPGWVDATAEVYATARQLYAGLELDRPRIRLVGVKCETFRSAAQAGQQLRFDDLPDPAGGGAGAGARPGIDRAVDAARARFGAAAIGFGTRIQADEPVSPADRYERDR
jgi:DNA polymerase-4